MAEFRKSNHNPFSDSQRIKPAKISALPAIVASLLIDLRNRNGNRHRFVHYRLEIESGIGLLHIRIQQKYFFLFYRQGNSQINRYSSFACASFAA
jgi:hypothetical protein